ncbi:MAG: hypothetical protein AAFX99_26475, partial [Myxococcota bacterium]
MMAYRPSRPEQVQRWKPHFAAADLIVVLDPTGVDAASMNVLRVWARWESIGMVMLRNATAKAIVDGVPVLASLRDAFVGPSLVVLVEGLSRSSLSALVRLVEPHRERRHGERPLKAPKVRRVWLRGVGLLSSGGWVDGVVEKLGVGSPVAAEQAHPSIVASPVGEEALVVSAAALQAIREALAPQLDIGASLAPGDPGDPWEVD